jgi:hypothetical protein
MHPFRAAIEAGDIDAAVGLLADDVVLHSPIVFAPYHGREAVEPIIRAVSQVLEGFRFVREIGAQDAAEHALVFRARIGDREIEGSDFVHLDAGGSIDELTVMVRPLNAAVAFAEAMRARLAEAGGAQGSTFREDSSPVAD